MSQAAAREDAELILASHVEQACNIFRVLMQVCIVTMKQE